MGGHAGTQEVQKKRSLLEKYRVLEVGGTGSTNTGLVETSRTPAESLGGASLPTVPTREDKAKYMEALQTLQKYEGGWCYSREVGG